MSRFRWGEPYRNPEGSMLLAWEKLGEACRGVMLRVLVLLRRTLRDRLGVYKENRDQ